MNFVVLEPPTKVAPQNLGVLYLPMIDLAFCESFLPKMVTYYQSVKVFSLKIFLLYSSNYNAIINLRRMRKDLDSCSVCV